MSLRPIILRSTDYLGSPREWGQPSSMSEGQIMWSRNRMDITCILPSKMIHKHVSFQRRKLVIRPDRKPWVPLSWEASMARYAVKWPHSAELQAFYSGYVPASARQDYLENTFPKWAAGMRGLDIIDAEETVQIEREIERHRAAWVGRYNA